MGYERDDRRPGSYSGDRGTSYGSYGGSGTRDYRGDRSNDEGRRDYGRDPRGYENDRGFFERAGDEVRSWFGDDEAERRRREDERRYEAENRYGNDQNRTPGYDRGYANRGYGDRGYTSGGSYGGSADRSYGGGAGSYGQGTYGQGGYESRGGGADRNQGHHDTSYRSWRDRQMEAFDRDYEDYRRENQSRFDQEFHSWRQGRQGQRDLLGKVREHQDVVGSDGQHVGTVDHVRGDDLKLAKNDEAAGGKHHLIPSSWIQSVDDKVTLSKTADQARQQWRDVERDSEGGLFGQGRPNEQNQSSTFDRAFGETDRQR